MKTGAGNGVRTRDPELGKLVLYQLSYTRIRPHTAHFPTIRQAEILVRRGRVHCVRVHVRIRLGVPERVFRWRRHSLGPRQRVERG